MFVRDSGAVTGKASTAAVAALIAEPARATMLDALMAGGELRASELGRRADVAPSTASEHLSRLLEGGLVVCEAHGRERRFRLASRTVADALEALALIAPPEEIRSLRASDRATALRRARTCYDHLAGELGVGLTEALVAQRLLVPADGAYSLSQRGELRLAELGIDLEAARTQRRVFARACLDWSERRPHLAGALGAALADAVIAHGWMARRPNDRALTVTTAGEAALRELGVAVS